MDHHTASQNQSPLNPYNNLLNALSLIPISHYLLAFLIALTVFLYNFLEIHFIEDLRNGLKGCGVGFTYNPGSCVYEGVVKKCSVLSGRYWFCARTLRYLATPWLSSPHIQTCFLNFFGRPPVFEYRRQLFHASDGGTIALDWLRSSDVSGRSVCINGGISKDDATPIAVLVPGLTSDSASAYIKHFAFTIAKHGWNVVISNHRGLGGVSVTSDCFYNAGWTEDIRTVINYLHCEYPNAPLFAVGTSIGANILVKYLGEDGENIPIAGAAAVCNPWDLLIGDRFICRKLVQKFYDRALTIGLQGYAQLHEPHYSRLANWEGIQKSRSIRDFDNYATCLVAKYETADTYYRNCSSASYVGKVSIPLLCISALDDPVCTKEAIPWDECRANKNVVLATPRHGGHLAFFEGISGTSLWWVRAVNEFLNVLHMSPYMHKQKKRMPDSRMHLSEISSDKGPFVNVSDGMVAAIHKQERDGMIEDIPALTETQGDRTDQIVPENIPDKTNEANINSAPTAQVSNPVTNVSNASSSGVGTSIHRYLHQLSRQNKWSIWLLAYIAIVTSWPLLGPVIGMVFKKKLKYCDVKQFYVARGFIHKPKFQYLKCYKESIRPYIRKVIKNK